MDDREQLHALLETYRGARRAILMTHDNPDPDCLACALAFQTLFRMRLGIPSLIVYGGILGRAENRQMVSVLKIPAIPLDEITLHEDDRVMLIDTQPRTGNNSLPDQLTPTAIIDHHPTRDESAAATHCDIREGFGATATLAFRYLRAADITPAPALATALFWALKVETRDLTREVSPADTEAYFSLLPYIDRQAIAEIEHAPVTRQYFRVLGQAISGTRKYGPIAIAAVGPVDAPEIVAEYADMLSRLEGVEWVLSTGEFEGALYMSLRTVHEHAHAGSVVQALVRGMGKAGGHGTMAGGRIPLSLPYLEVYAIISKRFLALMGAENLQGEAL